MMLYGILIERNIYKVNDLEIAFKDLPVEFDGYRIIHISDIHARSFGNRPEQLKKAVDTNLQFCR
jgi:predicted MPP superfamily phosphohydrolase